MGQLAGGLESVTSDAIHVGDDLFVVASDPRFLGSTRRVIAKACGRRHPGDRVTAWRITLDGGQAFWCDRGTPLWRRRAVAH